eukprot:6458035-Amphidinium_carterae.1
MPQWLVIFKELRGKKQTCFNFVGSTSEMPQGGRHVRTDRDDVTLHHGVAILEYGYAQCKPMTRLHRLQLFF